MLIHLHLKDKASVQQLVVVVFTIFLNANFRLISIEKGLKDVEQLKLKPETETS